MAASARPRRPAGWLFHHLLDRQMTAQSAARAIGAATALIVLGAGMLMRVVEPSTFPNIWLGLWWAVQTVTSVGYGDIVPHTVPGRLLALLVMINGIAFLTVVIATISAALVEAVRRRAETARLIDDPVLSALHDIERRLDAIEAELGRRRGD